MSDGGFTGCKFAWLEQVAADRELSTIVALRVAILISKHWNKAKGYAFPSLELLSAETNMSIRNVRRGLEALADRGHLDRRSGHGRRPNGQRFSRNRFTPILRQVADPAATAHDPGTDPETGQGLSSFEGPKPDKGCPLSEFQTGQVLSLKPDEGCPPKPDKGCPPEPVELNLKNEPESLSLSASPNDRPSGQRETDRLFDEFWSQYPLRRAKKKARAAFEKALKEGASPHEIVSGAMRYAAERDGQDPQFTKHPTTWLNGACWEDEPAPPSNGANGKGERRMSAAEFAERRADEIEQGRWQ